MSDSMQSKSETTPGVHGYWNFLVPQSEDNDREDLWRAYLKDVYRALGIRWRKTGSAGRTLKTDLYDEAICAHDLFSLFAEGSVCMVGTDVSLETAQAASRRLKQTGRAQDLIAVSDARRQAFKAQVFDEILSNSTLDHFSHRGDLLASLAELHRILKPGGVLIITLDNPWNPVVWVRNRLPYRLLSRLGIIPYYMGVTLSPPELMDALESAGFRVADSTVIVHSPRILAIWAGSLIGKTKWKWMKACFVSLLKAMEYTERLPIKSLTGYFVAAKAVKP
jgi:SAM-dependent methyltransferase